MNIGQKLLKKYVIANAIVLILSIIVNLFTIIYIVLSKNEAEVDSQLQAAKAVLVNTYTSGDLVALRAQMDSYAEANKWSFAEFRNPDFGALWTFKRTNVSKDTLISELFHVNASIVLRWSDNSVVGSLVVSKDYRSDMFASGKLIFYTVLTNILGFLFITVFMSFSINKISADFNSLVKYIIDSGRSLGLKLEGLSTPSEFTQIQVWFGKLIERWEELARHEIEAEKTSAIARLTQMLAHDVRKPFSMLETIFNKLKRTSSIKEVKNLLEICIPEFERARTQTNGLIDDVMEIGRQQKPIQAQVALESIIEPV